MSFPKGFLFGAATASYQIEGGWNADGKGENIWDRLVHTRPEVILNHDTGDVACDSYHLYKDDVKRLKEIGFDVYRFSISWSRILPTGEITNKNAAGIQYYHKLIDELLANGIQPMITIYHWDLPQPLQDIGGWMNPLMANYMEDYADILYREYGPKVKWWITINEPSEIINGYAKNGNAPYLNLDSPGNYIVGHNLLRAHAKAYRLYDRVYKKEQQGKVSITLSSNNFFAKSDSDEDKKAVERAFAFEFDWFARPVYGPDGNYPQLMREIVDKNSSDEGRRRSRLPQFTDEEKKELKGSADFFGLNHYTSRECSVPKSFNTLWEKDINAIRDYNPSWPSCQAPWLKNVPEGFFKILCYVKETYGNPAVFVTENGYCTAGGLEDDNRIGYYKGYLSALLKAVNDNGCNVIGYTAWSILDNFEWTSGYDYHFGIIQVDFNDEKRKRTPRKSAFFFQKLLATRELPQ